MTNRNSGAIQITRMGTISKTVDLPISSGVPVELDTTLSMVRGYYCYVRDDFRWTVAVDSATAVTNFADKSKYFLNGKGAISFDCGGEKTRKIYIISDSSAVVDGLSVQSLEYS